MNIGEASAQSGVSAKMIRHYEKIGLLPASARRANGYRDYGGDEVAELQFIRRARDLGFSLEDVGRLLALWRDRTSPSREVKKLAEMHLQDMERRIAEMQAMARTLKALAHACKGDDRPSCPIIDDLAHAPAKKRKG
jgi:Cu(I)-responsive transcriptional regulator